MNEKMAREICEKHAGKIFYLMRDGEVPHELIRAEGFLLGLEQGRIEGQKSVLESEEFKDLAYAIEIGQIDLTDEIQNFRALFLNPPDQTGEKK